MECIDVMEVKNVGKINWNKPKKIRSTEKYIIYFSDSGIDGTYVPNMSREDMESWKGKRIGGDNKRIELRKTFNVKTYYAQMLIVIRPGNENDPNILISTNGKIALDFSMWEELKEVIEEARKEL